MSTPCTLKYEIRGIANAGSTATQVDVCEEVQEVLSYPGLVSAKPLSDGLEVSISVTDIEPFSREQFEPYIYEHVIWHALNACCEMQDDGFEIRLIHSKFG